MRRFFALVLVLGMMVSMFIPQTLLAQATPIDVSIDMVPLNPDPGAAVTLRATSYGADLSQSTLTWVYNSQTIASAIGKTSVSVIAPAGGKTGTVTVTVSGIGLQSGAATIFLRPASVDMLWEAVDSYTPPFYKGKALLPVGGVVRVTAIPSASAPKNLSYDWSKNGSALQDSSGYNKSSIIFQQNILNNQERLDLTVHSGAFSGTNAVSVAPSDLGLVAYQNKEGFIDYANGYNSTIPFSTSGAILHFEPYYFSVPQSIAKDLTINTTVDGETVTSSQSNELGISRPAIATQSSLKLAILTSVYSLQHLEKTFTLLFN